MAAKKELTVAEVVQKKSSNERFMPFLIILVAVLAFAVGALWREVEYLQKGGSPSAPVANQPQAPSGPTDGKLDAADAEKLAPVDTTTDHIRGNLANAEVILIEYSDFECPFCARFHPSAQQIFDEYEGRVAWVYRHFPLDQIHPQARPAAIVSECIADNAGNDAFWKFADSVFASVSKQESLTNLDKHITASGANLAAVKSCAEEASVESIVDAQMQTGIEIGVNGTPGNFIVNKQGDVWSLPGAVSAATLRSTVEEALAAN